MSYLVCETATCECKFGNKPATLEVKTNPEHYINSIDGEKQTASSVDIGNPFKEQTFGKCSKQGNPQPPCKPDITKWEGFYDKVTLKNGGKILLDNSKAICSIAGSPCISITHHGQSDPITQHEMDNTSDEQAQVVSPLVDISDYKNNYKYDAK